MKKYNISELKKSISESTVSRSTILAMLESTQCELKSSPDVDKWSGYVTKVRIHE